jgi:hypothetical protein
MMEPVFAAIEANALSTWLREAPTLWAFPFVLILHTVGLAFLVGANVAVDARILGLAAPVPLASLERYFLVAWIGFWVNAISGTLLLIAYPTKALTNPLFYGKLALVAGGLVLMQAVRRYMGPRASSPGFVIRPRLKVIAALSLACWAATITAGRLLAYTYTYLTVDDLP